MQRATSHFACSTVTVFEAPDTTRLHGPAVRRGRQIRRRRAGAAAGGAVALAAAGVLAFTFSAAPGHGTSVVVAIAQALPSPACLGGTFSQPVDAPTPGSADVPQHVRCSTDGSSTPTTDAPPVFHGLAMLIGALSARREGRP